MKQKAVYQLDGRHANRSSAQERPERETVDGVHAGYARKSVIDRWQ